MLIDTCEPNRRIFRHCVLLQYITINIVRPNISKCLCQPSEEITQSSFLFLFLAKSRNLSLIVTRHRASRPLGRLNTTSALNTFLGTPSWRVESRGEQGRHETTGIKTGEG